MIQQLKQMTPGTGPGMRPALRGAASLIGGQSPGATSPFARLRSAVKPPGSMPNINPMGAPSFNKAQPINDAVMPPPVGAAPGPAAPPAPPAAPTPTPAVPFQPPAAPQVQYPSTAQVTQINPLDDLRSKQITPGAGQSRSDIASGRLRLFEEEQGDERRRGITDIGRAASSLGRLNSGMVTTDLGNLEERLGISRNREAARLAGDTAEGEISDARYDRGELRGERDYQTGQAQQGLDNRVRQLSLEEALLQGQHDRGYDQSRLELGQADRLDQSADSAMGGLGELFKEAARRKAAERAGTLGGINMEPPTRLPQGMTY